MKGSFRVYEGPLSLAVALNPVVSMGMYIPGAWSFEIVSFAACSTTWSACCIVQGRENLAKRHANVLARISVLVLVTDFKLEVEQLKKWSSLLRSWITFNEPWCSTVLGYANGEMAPGKKDNNQKLWVQGSGSKVLKA